MSDIIGIGIKENNENKEFISRWRSYLLSEKYKIITVHPEIEKWKNRFFGDVFSSLSWLSSPTIAFGLIIF